MPRQTRHDWLLARRRIASRGTKAWRWADRCDRRLRLEPLEERLALTVLTVNSLSDGPINLTDEGVTLRDALDAANRDVQVSHGGPSGSGADEIRFEAGLLGTITLTQGQLGLSSDVTITGPGASVFSVVGNSDSHLFSVNEGGATNKTVLIRGLNISGGATVRGIFNAENLTIENCTISGNIHSDGGGIYNHALGTLSLLNSTISDSRAGNSGGGIFNAGTLMVQNSTISGNGADGSGGGILNVGTLMVQNSTISGNESSYGGGISNSGPLTIDSSTITSNLTSFGGAGVFTAVGDMMVRSSTITQNHSDRFNSTGAPGGGIAVNSGVVTLHNTIVADNIRGDATTDDDVDGGLSGSSTSNLIGTGGSGGLTHGMNGNQVGVAIPGLVPLANNGGPTWTHALLAGSPAIDAGDPAIASPPTNDQRGAPFVRIADGDAAGGARIDVGAYERQTVVGLSLVVDALFDEDDGNYNAGDLALREAIGLANGSVGPDAITFAAALSAHTILLGGMQLFITEAVTIDATALADNVAISAQQNSRIFDITATTGDFTLGGLTLTGGRVTAGDATGGYGGAIRSRTSGNLTLTQSTVSGNSTTGEGGGIFASASVTLTQSTVYGNSTTGFGADGGGISAGAVTLTQSTVSGNSTTGFSARGGGIFAFGSVELTQSTVSGNITTGEDGGGGGILAGAVTLTQSTVSGNITAGEGADGGGISAGGAVTLTQSTVSGNSTAGDFAIAGGILAGGAVTLTQSTVSGNRSLYEFASGGVVQANRTFNHPFTINGSILAGNTMRIGQHDLVKDPESTLTVNYSLIGTGIIPTVGGNNIVSNIPMLAPLANNGGPTETRALLSGSPAIDKGDPSVVFDAAQFDQRGAPFVRVVDGDPVPGDRIDIGAFELQSTASTTASADFDGDADVDGADFLRWQRGLGATGAAATRTNGNADNDGDVDGFDLVFWKLQFAGPPPAVAESAALSRASTSESEAIDGGRESFSPAASFAAAALFDGGSFFERESPSVSGRAAVATATGPPGRRATLVEPTLVARVRPDAAWIDRALSPSNGDGDEQGQVIGSDYSTEDDAASYRAGVDAAFHDLAPALALSALE